MLNQLEEPDSPIVDILEKRPYFFYWTNNPFEQDIEAWHYIGIRIGEC
jgi:hypothetical protein